METNVGYILYDKNWTAMWMSDHAGYAKIGEKPWERGDESFKRFSKDVSEKVSEHGSLTVVSTMDVPDDQETWLVRLYKVQSECDIGCLAAGREITDKLALLTDKEVDILASMIDSTQLGGVLSATGLQLDSVRTHLSRLKSKLGIGRAENFLVYTPAE